jgi:hypothetical protein
MRRVTLRIPIVALALCLGTAPLHAQQPGNGDYQWYIGAHGGMISFRTPAQSRGTIPFGGGHVLITAKRTGLLISVEEALGSDELSSYVDGSNATQFVRFDNIRKYSAMLMAFPLRIPIQPYLGVGFGVIHVVKPSTLAGGTSDAANELGSSGFGSFLGGVQFKVARFVGFGQYQITTSPSIERSSGFGARVGTGRLLEGPTHTFSAGLRIGLGSARERPASGGY